MILSIVLFPQPDGPTTPTNSPRSTVRERSFSATVPSSNRLWTWLRRRMGPGTAWTLANLGGTWPRDRRRRQLPREHHLERSTGRLLDCGAGQHVLTVLPELNAVPRHDGARAGQPNAQQRDADPVRL